MNLYFEDSDNDMLAEARAVIADSGRCSCGRPGCHACLATKLIYGGKSPVNHISQKEKPTMHNAKHEEIAARFENGAQYINDWHKNKSIRDEFNNDFEAYCHYEAAMAAGRVKSIGGE